MVGQIGGAEVAQAEAGGLGAGEGAAGGQTLSGDGAGPLVLQLLVLSEEVADLPAAHTDVTRRDVGVLTDVAVELIHKGLAEPHDLAVGLTLWVEVGPALAAAHGEGGQTVLKSLLKGQEFHDRLVDRGMESQPPLIGAQGGAVLHPETVIQAGLALIVHPGHREADQALRLGHAAHDVLLLIAGVGIDHRGKGLQKFLHSLEVLGLVGVAGPQIIHHGIKVSVLKGHC